MKILKNYSLKKLNTFGVDARAERFVSIKNPEQIIRLLDSGELEHNRKLILGGGSNILLAGDFPGLVISVDIKGIRMVKIDGGEVLLEVGAGEIWHDFVTICVKNKYYGVENLALIPGKVGAAPVQNIGAYGVEQDSMFVSLKGINIESGEELEFSKDDCRFGYRDSIFKNELKDKIIITRVYYKLSKEEKINLSYKALQDEVNKFVVAEPDLEYVYNAVIRIRNRKLPDPNKIGNAGSFFKNPVISKVKYNELKEKFPGIPGYEALQGVKTSAGWLIEQCSWKGKRKGDAGVYDKHALILVNYGNATGEEIYNFSEEIRQSVLDKFGFNLEREVNVITV